MVRKTIASKIIKQIRADKCLTPSRSRSKRKQRNYSNKYTQKLGELGYKGIKRNGYFSKFYAYGVVGHCCIGVQYHLIKGGYPELVPRSEGYIWNTNNYAKWLKSEPTIKGLGKVDWTDDLSKANQAAKSGKMVITFKGKKGHKSYTHTCVLRYIQDGKVHTVDFNVSGRYKGKRINNGVLKSRKASSYRWGFAILPIPVVAPKYIKGETYKLTRTMNVRDDHSTKAKLKRTLKSGTTVKALEVWKSQSGVYWIRTAYGWICAKTKEKTNLR